MTNPQQTNTPGGHEIIEENFDTQGLFLDYLSHWKFFIISLILCLAAAYCYRKSITPMYSVGASVYLNDDNASKTSAVSMTIPTIDPMDEMNRVIDETEIEIMKSRNSLLKVVDTLQLQYSYYRVESWHNVPIYKTNPVTAKMDTVALKALKKTIVLELEKSGDGFDVKVGDLNDLSESSHIDALPAEIETAGGIVTLSANGDNINQFDGTQRITIEKPNTVAARMAAALNIEYAEKASTILNFTFNAPVPELGEDVLKMLIYFYNRQVMDDKNLSAIQTEEFIQARVRDVQNELKEASNRVREYEERKNIIDRQQQINTDLNRTSSAQSEIIDLRAKEELLRASLNDARNITIDAKKKTLQILGPVSSNTSVNTAITEYNKTVNQYNNQRMTMTEEQPLIQSLASSANQQLSAIISNLEMALSQVKTELSGLYAIESRSTSQLASQPEVSMGYKEVKLDEEVKNNILTFLLQRREEIALQKTLTTPTAQFIDNPSVQSQVQPKTMLIYVLGFIIGLLIPGLYILVKRLLFPQFKEKEDLERITSVPVIGEICLAGKSEDDIVVGEGLATSEAELFRLLRNNINFARTEGEKKIILLTSSTSGEGKTFVAMNLALTYALTGKRTAVIGLDIRRPVLAGKFGVSNRTGLTNYLSGQIDDIDLILIQSDLNSNLCVIPAGPIPPNPNELLMSERMENFFNELRSRFDYIIVDTAPIGLVSDSLLIIPHTDIQLFVTRASYTTRKGLKTLHDAINTGQMPVSYIVLNGVNMRSRSYNYHRYGHYNLSNASYGYGYGYSHGKSSSRRPWYKRLFKRH